MAQDTDEVLGRLADRLISGHLRREDVRDRSVPAKIGRYDVLRPLGRGSGGRVYLATDPSLGRTVAIKVLARASATAAERFEREMRVLARLEHPGIVKVYDAGTSEDGPYFVM